MEIDSQFDFTIFMAFESLIKYENRKSITIQELKKYRKVLLDEILDIYKNGRGHNYLQEIDQWKGKVFFKKNDENLNLEEFLCKYNEFIFLKNDKICLKDNVTYYDIRSKLSEIRIKDNVPNRFYIIEGSKKLREVLGISSIEKIVKDYYKIEERLEKLYYKLYTKDDTVSLRKEIKKLLLARFTFLTNIASLPDYRADAFRIASINSYDVIDDSNIYYDNYPLDLKLWQEQESIDPDDFLDDIDPRVYDITQYAIFGKKNNVLYQNKVTEDLNNFDISEHFLKREDEEQYDPNIDYTEEIENELINLEKVQDMYENNPENVVELHDPTEEFWVLYINYLNNLNKYMEIYGESEELMFAKKRLLYALDKPLLMIFDNDNFNKELEKTKEIELEDEPFDFFVDEIYFIASEVFKVSINEYTIKKLILVGTYYNLTQDQEILDIVNNFKNHPNYDFFYDIMINNCSNKIIKDNLTEDVKKLILKPKDKKNS